jgi:uncharacterized protein (TIRG00374 family)
MARRQPGYRDETLSDPPTDPSESSLAVKIDSEKAHPLAWKTVAKRAATVIIAGITIYLVFPAITEVLASWPRLSTLDPRWFTLAVAAEVAHFICTFALQRMALRTRAWFPVVTSQLAGNAITLIIPGGAAVGAAVQFRMLATSGMEMSSAVGGLAAFSLLGVGGLLALPVFVLPVILLGTPVTRGLVNAAILGTIGFVAFAGFGAVLLAYDAPLRWAARLVQALRNWVFRKRPPMEGLDETILAQRDEIRTVLGKQWWQALLLSSGRLAFDYLCLLAALRATGSRPRPSLILVAYAVAGIIGMIPVTPGGLGLVEASLTGLLVLAEVDSSQAVLATLTYRLASYWAPLCAGPIAYVVFRIRYRGRLSSQGARDLRCHYDAVSACLDDAPGRLNVRSGRKQTVVLAGLGCFAFGCCAIARVLPCAVRSSWPVPDRPWRLTDAVPTRWRDHAARQFLLLSIARSVLDDPRDLPVGAVDLDPDLRLH